MMSRLLCMILMIVPLCICGGCGGRPSRVPVSGKVLLDGKPLETGTIIFTPDNGRKSSGLITNGNFTLGSFAANDGALVGLHKISVASTEFKNRETEIKYLIPPKYGDPATSGLKQEIKGSTDAVVIELTWKGNKPSQPYTEPVEGADSDDAMAARFRRNREGSKGNKKD